MIRTRNQYCVTYEADCQHVEKCVGRSDMSPGLFRFARDRGTVLANVIMSRVARR